MRFRFTLSTEAVTVIPAFPNLSYMTNTGAGTAWTTGATPSVTLPLSSSQILRGIIEGGIENESYQIDYNLTVSGLAGGPHNVLVRIRLYDSTFTNYVDDATAAFFTNGVKTGFVTLTPGFVPHYIGFLALQSTGAGVSVAINSYDADTEIFLPGDSLEITEPDGWKDCTLKLERHNDYHSLVEHFEGDFTFYGQNEFVNGGIDFIKEKLDSLGVDVTINILIELALDDVNYETVFSGQLATAEATQLVNNKLKCNIIRDDFWSKFINRRETPVDLQSTYSLDGEEVTVYDSVNLSMTSQVLMARFLGRWGESIQIGPMLGTSADFGIIDFDIIELDEIPQKFNYPVTFTGERPFELFAMEYGGEYEFTIRICLSYVRDDQSDSRVTDSLFDVKLQVNNDAAVSLSTANRSLGGGYNVTDYTIQTTLSLNKGDFVYLYIEGNGDDGNYTLWLLGDDNGLLTPTELISSVNETSLSVIGNTVFAPSNAEGFLLHDVFAHILDRIISQDEVLYSEILGSPATLARIYEQYGCYWAYVLLKGLQIRQYSLLEKPFFLSFKQAWEGANPILNLGLGYETIDEPPEDSPTVDTFGNEQQLGTGDSWGTLVSPLRHSCTPSSLQSSKLLAFEIFGGMADVDYNIGYDLTCNQAGSITIRLYNEALTDSVSDSVFFGIGGGNQIGTTVLTPTFIPKYLTFRTSLGDGVSVFDVEPFTFSVDGIPDPEPYNVIRIEEKAHFYDDSFTSLYISNVRELEVSYDRDHHFNLVRVGYNKWESESTSGIDDPQTKREFNTRFKKTGQAIDLYSAFIAAGLTIETTRRQTKEKSADYKYDNDTFIVAIRPDPVEVSPETSPDVTDYQPELDENFDSILNLENSDTRYNLRLTPTRNLIRWLNYLSGCLQKYLSSAFSFASGEGNYDMISQMSSTSPDCGDDFSSISENGNIDVSSDYLFIPKLIKMTVPFTWEDYVQVRQYRKNPIAFSQTDENHINLFIKELSFKPILGMAEISGWPTEDFNMVVPEDTFSSTVCYLHPPGVEECAMTTEDDDTIITETNEVMVLEEC